MMSGIGSTIMQGMAFGTGSAMAHQAIGAITGSFGGSKSEAPAAAAPAAPEAPAHHQTPAPSAGADKCDMDLTAFNNCMKDNRGNIASCDFYFQALQQCQSSSY
jgi:hypothetical protein